MYHAARFSAAVLVLLKGIDLDMECPFNGTRSIRYSKNCSNTYEYISEYCRCNNATIFRNRYVIGSARKNCISFANTEKLSELKDVIELLGFLFYTRSHFLENIRECKSRAEVCLLSYERKKQREKYYRDAIDEIEGYLSSVANAQVTLYYKMPPLITFMLVTGMIGNLTLLYIFLKNPEMRSGPRMLLMNITISAILLLLFNVLGKYYFQLYPFKLGERECRLFTFLTVTPVIVSILSITVLSIARYYRTVHLCPRIGILLVWTAASLAALKPSQESFIKTYNFSDKTYCLSPTSPTTAIVMFTVTCFLPFVIIGFFTTATCCRGRPKDMPEERNAKILPVLAVIFSITYAPFQIYWLIASIYEFALSSVLVWFYFFTDLILNITSPLYPAALYLSSGMFRQYFDKYLSIRYKRDQKEPRKKPQIELYSWEI